MSDDARLSQWLASHRGPLAGGSPDAHVDVETLARHATGQLAPARAHAVTEHLVVCSDGRCVAFVRAQGADVDAAADLLYPPPAEGAARPRTFQCRDALWQLFEAAADDTQLPIDDLLDEAMVAYARARGYLENPTQRRRETDAVLEETQDARSAQAHLPAAEELDESEPSRRRPPSLSPVTMRTLARPAPGAPPPPSSRRAPPPLPSTPMVPIVPPGAAIGTLSLAKRLVLSYAGQRYDVDKEHFIIGRSKTQADLRINDANVSRQHAAIERIGSIYYLVDLGSTNGVYVGDDRVTRRALVDGDEIVITSHRIVCSLR